MVKQNFVGDEPVDAFPSEAIQKVDEDELTRRELHRDPAKEPGANRREGVASRNPTGKHRSLASVGRSLIWVFEKTSTQVVRVGAAVTEIRSPYKVPCIFPKI